MRKTTKKELMQSITLKVQKAKPPVRKLLLDGLQYKTKSELERIDKNVKVSRSGWNIELG